MLGFIWKNLWRHKERFILLLAGAIIISAGLSYLVGLSETNKGTIVDDLQNSWDASYDIVVRPPGTRSITEAEGLVEPNYLSGIDGGITIEQYEKIKAMSDVDIAAPVSMIGYTGLTVDVDEFKVEENGIYRITTTNITNNGVNDEIAERHNYGYYGTWEMPKSYYEYGADAGRKYYQDYGVGMLDYIYELSISSNSLLVGIDPEEEAKLVGLDQAILPIGEGRYFTKEDKSYMEGYMDYKVPNIPILVSKEPFVDKQYKVEIEKLDAPYSNTSEINDTMATIKENGGKEYLDTLKVEDGKVWTYTYDSENAYNLLIRDFTGIDPITGEKIKNQPDNDSGVKEKASPLKYKDATSPYSDRWPYAYEVEPIQNDELKKYWDKPPQDNFREPKDYGYNSKLYNYRFLGFYDPELLNISKDPLNELPMETYRPASAKLVIDEEGNPVNPPIDIKPTSNPNGLLTSPPVILTTIDAAELIMGEQPISAIRIKVKGVNEINEESQAKLEKVAKDIEEQTGLITDITLGSSPQPTIVHVPENGDNPELGWIEQPWVKIGASMTIFRETKLGFSGIILSVLLVAVVYIFATNLVSILSRRKEFAVLLAVGWRPSQLVKMVYLEAMLFGTFVALVAWAMESFALHQNNMTISTGRFFLIGFTGFIIYILGAIWPAILVTRISPYETMRTGEITKNARRIIKIRSLFAMSFSNLIGKLNRSILSILSIAVPTTLLVFFLFVTLRLEGVLYTTWLGQFISVEIGPAHYIAMIIALLISILTTTEIMWQNVMERKPEIALLRSMGWRNGAIRFLIIWEGFFIGLIAGIIGILIGLLLIWWMYSQFPLDNILFILATALIPITVGMLGSIIPAEIAVRVKPSQGLVGQYSSKKKTAKSFGAAVTVIVIISLIAFGTALITIIPKDTAPTSAKINNEQEEKVSNTQADPSEEENLTTIIENKQVSQTEQSKADYKIDFTMNNNGTFKISSEIDVKNFSQDTWDYLSFYFTPNIYTENNENIEKPADITITQVQVNGEDTNYSLEADNLEIPLTNELKPNKDVKITIAYEVSLPVFKENYTLGFQQINTNYYLPQSYPILAAYEDGWKKYDYYMLSRYFYTNPADFEVNYQIPEGYTLISSANDKNGTTGSLEAKDLKDFYIAVVKDMEVKTIKVGDITINVYGKEDKQAEMDKALTTAIEAVQFFEKEIGPYPNEEIDIVIAHIANFTYPGVNTIYDSVSLDFVERKIVKEIAYDWFYQSIKLDQYNNSWIIESLSELAKSLFYYDYKGYSQSDSFRQSNTYINITKERGITDEVLKSNLSLNKYNHDLSYMSFVFARPTLNMWSIISEDGEAEEGLKFLKEFYKGYEGKLVDTYEFVRFTKEYLNLEDYSYFEDWLEFE